MDFFKSVFSQDPEPSDTENPNPKPNRMWSSVFENYRKDFEEFRSGLQKETAVIREAASRAVKDLPASFEVGASVAQESLESVGQAIDDIGSTVWKSTAEIISHGRRNLLTESPDQYNSDSDNNINSSGGLGGVKRYSRFEMQLRSIQSDYDTYCREPGNLEEYEDWKLGFKLDDEKNIETENLLKENGVIGEIYRDVVSTNKVVDEETFWRRYFYRLHKLKQAEEARARLVKRAISMDEDEDLSWDIDDDEENNGSLVKSELSGNLELEKRDSDGNVMSKNDAENSKNGNSGIEGDENEKLVVMEEKAENSESCKDSDMSVVSQPSMPEEEDLSWDAIEDIGNHDENKGDVVGSMSRADLHKRLSTAEEDEDLSWDIEDDDEPVKS
ncbi:BSD domain-containing protein 1-like [Melia azedarach]|uniref:BSD domain-containing protein 1-like n=1 Tax=Melia azedarach TaxID=155640 RepID=A0ACC1YEU5_MELAZ|nr:BSD domain-containing protein 1-like [Melia azedarach]